MPNPTRAPALLMDATWYGTLAAARDLGSRGVPVTLASDAVLAPARWSRFVARTVRAPSTRTPERLLAWLMRFGQREPGHVLYPTSDETAWLIARSRDELATVYRLYSPSEEALANVLDKERLSRLGSAAGLDVPESWTPATEEEVAAIARDAAFPLLIKPRAQFVTAYGGKPIRVENASDLLSRWRAWRHEVSTVSPANTPGDLLVPLVQQCHSQTESIYTVDGFVTRSGEIVVRGCTKVLQLPRRTGPGVYFESAEVDARTSHGLLHLCRAAGYFGVFDAEFIADGPRQLLIDFNPRFYNHMAFEVDRGMPLPWLAYLGALGDEGALRDAVEEARRAAFDPRRVYAYRMMMTAMLAMQSVSGAMTFREWRGWRERLRARATTDPSYHPADPLPVAVDVAMQAVSALRHPRTFVRRLSAKAYDLAATTPTAAAVLEAAPIGPEEPHQAKTR